MDVNGLDILQEVKNLRIHKTKAKVKHSFSHIVEPDHYFCVNNVLEEVVYLWTSYHQYGTHTHMHMHSTHVSTEHILSFLI